MLFHCDIIGPDPDAFKLSFKKCFDLAKEKSSKQVSIVVEEKSQFLEGTVFNEILGEDFVKAIVNNPITIEGIDFEVLSEKTLYESSDDHPFLACNISFKLVSKLISWYAKSDLVYLPWQEDDLPPYFKKYESVEIFKRDFDS